MQSDRLNISLFFAALAGLATAISLAIAGMHREASITMLAVGVLVAICAPRISAAQHALAERPQFPKSWKKSRPFQFMLAGAGMALSGIAALLTR